MFKTFNVAAIVLLLASDTADTKSTVLLKTNYTRLAYSVLDTGFSVSRIYSAVLLLSSVLTPYSTIPGTCYSIDSYYFLAASFDLDLVYTPPDVGLGAGAGL